MKNTYTQIPQSDSKAQSRASEEASLLMEFLLDEQLSPETHRRLEEWFSKESGKEIKIKAFLDFVEKEIKPNKAPDSYEYLKFRELADSLGIIYPVKKLERKKSSRLHLIGRVAAVLIPVLLVVGTYLWFGHDVQSDYMIVSVMKGTPAESVILPDGSLVEVFAGSTLSYPREFENGRNVSLSGSAMFRVEKSATAENTARPFTVGTDNFSVTVLGTDFLVSEFPEDSLSSVSLYSGDVSVRVLKDTTYMVSGERLEYNKNTGTSKVTIISSMEMIAKGYKPRLKFKDASLGELLNALTVVFEVEMEVSPEIDTKKGKHSVELDGETLDNALKIVVMMNDNKISYKIEEKKVTIIPYQENK